MKRLLKVLAAAIISVGALGASAAAQTCSVSNTGPDSTNNCTSTNTNTTNIDCTNTTNLTNTNDQGSNSGSATSGNNTNAGGASSGDASNSNKSNADIQSGCAPAKAAAPVSGGQGAVTGVTAAGGAGAAAAEAAKGGALPKTGANPLAIGAVVASVLGGVAIASRLAAVATRRISTLA